MFASEGLFLIIISLILFVSIFLKIKKHKNIQKWPKVKGKIKSSSLRLCKGTNDGFNLFPKLIPEIYYEYDLREQSFSNSVISLNNISFYNHKKAEEYINQYEAENSIDIYYNPSDHKISYLDISNKPKFTKRLLFGIILFIMGSITLFM